MAAKLYGSESSFRTQKVLITAKLANKEVELAGNKLPRNKFPLGIMPAFEDNHVKLFGAEAIMLYLAESASSLKGSSCAESLQWTQWAEGHLLPAVLAYVLPSISAAQVDQKVVETARNELFAQLKTFNELLLTRTYLVGERISLADITVALDLLPAYQYVLDDAARKPLINVNRWFNTIINQPAVKSVLGEVTFATSVPNFSSEKFVELSAKLQKDHSAQKSGKEKERGKQKEHGKPKVQQGDKEGKKGKQQNKKDEEDDADEMDEVMAQEPKSVDPFASMPKGTFVMDAFKKVYSNEDTATKAIPYFWENFDAENYSIWFAEYKYPEDLTLTFMSCNLIGGMFQRLEKLKKNAFASVCLFGTDNNSTISGIWIWRGHELVFTLCPDWQIDYESYDWKKLDPSDEDTKKLVNEYLMWEGDFGGKKFNQGKIFK